jgi:hypothetical protein
MDDPEAEIECLAVPFLHPESSEDREMEYSISCNLEGSILSLQKILRQPPFHGIPHRNKKFSIEPVVLSEVTLRKVSVLGVTYSKIWLEVVEATMYLRKKKEVSRSR